MLSYLTPARYRTIGLGMDLSAKTDADLASVLAMASIEVNRWCAAPVNHDFRGATVVAEEHLWDVGNSHRYPSGRLWPKHGMGVMPITACPQIDIYTTKTNYIRFNETQIFLNSRLGYVEPVAAPLTTALITSVPPWLLTSPVAYVNYSYGSTFSIVDEPLIDIGDHLTYYAQNQWWTDDEVTATTSGGAVTFPADATIDRNEGTITFASNQGPGALITASYTHKLAPEIRTATAIVATDMLGYANINASGLTGLSGIKVEEIELRQSRSAGFGNYDIHPGAKILLGSFMYASFG